MSNKPLSEKQDEARIRQELHNKLTPQEKLAKLDQRLGEGVGAIKERERLNTLIG